MRWHSVNLAARESAVGITLVHDGLEFMLDLVDTTFDALQIEVIDAKGLHHYFTTATDT